METPTPSPRLPGADSLFVRWAAVAVLALAMAIPLQTVRSLVHERSARYDEVLGDISGVWGQAQTLQGPVLVVPFTESYGPKPPPTPAGQETAATPAVHTTQRWAVVLPDALSIDVDLREERLHRGIHDALVYAADIGLSGTFGDLDLGSLSEHLHEIQWDKAWVSIGLSDPTALSAVGFARWGGEDVELGPGTDLPLLPSGFHAPVALTEGSGDGEFRAELAVKGSGGVRFAPFGKNTDVTMRSAWRHPSFQGSPTSSTVTDAGFTARWAVSHLTRGYPQRFVVSNTPPNLAANLAGVDLFEPVTLYDKVGRGAKYGLLFVCLTFLVFVLFELTSKGRLHFVQYGLVGIALSLFYLTLLALAEHVAFSVAYGAASLVVVAMITLFSWGALRSGARAGVIGAVLTLLYGVLFVILRMEQFALLAGTVVLLLATAASMYMTRELNEAGEA